MSASSTVPGDDLGVATIPGPNRFGVFIAPYHDPAGNPSVQIRRDLDLVKLLDDLGYDEAWFGEHHSGAYETIASPGAHDCRGVRTHDPDPVGHRRQLPLLPPPLHPR